MTRTRLSPHVPSGGSTHLAEGMIGEVLDDGQLVVFRFTNLAAATVDSAAEAMGALMRRRDEAGQPLRVLLDFSQPDLIQTPYVREQGARLSRLRPRLRGRVALLALEGTLIATRIDRILRSELYHYRERSLFFRREQALAWLRDTPERGPLG